MVNGLNANKINNIYALSCAGGTRLLFSKLGHLLKEKVFFNPIELPGHGCMIKNNLIPDFQRNVDYVYSVICENNKNQNYAILGYSMGSLIAYEVCCRMSENNQKLPVRLFLAASNSPKYSANYWRKGIKENDDEYLKKTLFDLGGIPIELYNKKEFQEYLFPIIKNDILALNNYHPSEVCLLNVNITSMYGEEDRIILNDEAIWENYTSGKIETLFYKGGHFFINTDIYKVAMDISARLSC